MSQELQPVREPAYYLLPKVYRRGHNIVCRNAETGQDEVIPVTYEGPFGFTYRQSRPDHEIVYHARDIIWFNGAGQILGYGALSIKDLKKVATQIAPHELFLISKRRGLDPQQLQKLREGSLKQIMSCCEVIIGTGEIRFATDSILAHFLREFAVPQLIEIRKGVQAKLKEAKLRPEELMTQRLQSHEILTRAELTAITLQSQEIITSGAMWNGIYWRNLSRQDLMGFLAEQRCFRTRLLEGDDDGIHHIQIEITGPIQKI